MRTLFASLTLSLICPALFAASGADEALEKLNQAAQDPTLDFMAVYAEALEAGVTRANLVQARTLYAMRAGDTEQLILLAPQMKEVKDELDYGPGKFFVSKEQLLGLAYSLEAVVAYRNDDWNAFETAAREAYWLWPEWPKSLQLDAMIMEQRIDQIKAAQLAKLVIPMDAKVKDLDGQELTLASLAEGQKALLVDFWASWCGPCMRLMPDLKKKAQTLGPQGVLVAGLNTDGDEPAEKARRVQDSEEMDMTWLLVGDSGLQELLYVDTIPRMALIAPDGKLLWTGHPTDPELLEALKQLGVNPDA